MSLNTALVVDDDDAVRRCVAAILEPEGFHILEAENGASALAALRKAAGPVQVVISDIQMQGVDGVTFFEDASEEFPGMPFVFITGHADSERMVSVPSQYPVITKPFSAQTLITCLRFVLDKEKRS